MARLKTTQKFPFFLLRTVELGQSQHAAIFIPSLLFLLHQSLQKGEHGIMTARVQFQPWPPTLFDCETPTIQHQNAYSQKNKPRTGHIGPPELGKNHQVRAADSPL